MDFQWQAVFWDFDGVVLDSVHVKTKAFARMFAKYGPEIEQMVVEYHLAHGGISRYEKFKYYYSELLKKSVTDKELTMLGAEFSHLVLDEVLAAPFIPGALEALQFLSREKIPCYVVSGTPEEEVRHIVAVRKLSSYFVDICGAPRKKHAILSEILHQNVLDPIKCLFLGDAMTDYEAAKIAGTKFLGIVSDVPLSPFPEGTNISQSIDLKYFSCWSND